MLFTEYKFNPEALTALTAQKANNLKLNRQLSDPIGFWVSVVIGRLEQDQRRYRDYGPYWWALKSVLRRHDTDYGPQTDPLVEREYIGGTDGETIIAADEFRTANLARNFLYTNRFLLEVETGDWYELYDSDMENPPDSQVIHSPERIADIALFRSVIDGTLDEMTMLPPPNHDGENR